MIIWLNLGVSTILGHPRGQSWGTETSYTLRIAAANQTPVNQLPIAQMYQGIKHVLFVGEIRQAWTL